MAAITKASIKATVTRRGSGKKPFFVFVTIFLILVALFDFFMIDPSQGRLIEEVEKSALYNSDSVNDGEGDSTTSNGPVANSSNNNDRSKVVDPFYPQEVDKRHLAYIFHRTPSDIMGKEGHVIMDMLLGHSYVFHQRQIYGGSCGSGNDVGRDPERSLIKAIGLEDVIRFACPSEIDSPLRKKEIPRKNHVQDGTRALTPEYVNLLKSVTIYPERKDNQYTIVVHIRRGKFTPCRKPVQDVDPYLPNKHYQLLIDKNMKPDAKVVIYSQEPSFESLDEFKEKGYEMHIDEDIADVWTAAMTADVFIMSRSDFSFVPAVLTKATVVYTPYWDKPLRNWNVVGTDVLEQSEAEFKRLKATCKYDSKLDKLRKRLGKE